MIGLITRWLLTALALILTTKIVPGIQVASITTLFVASLVLGLLNAIVRPILIFFTLPLTIVTLLIWICVIFLGRLIAYDHIWGSWSGSTKA